MGTKRKRQIPYLKKEKPIDKKMEQLAKLKNITHQRKCNGCHEMFSSDVLGSDDKNKDFLCSHCNNDRYLMEEDTHEDCSVCKKLTWKDDLGKYPNGFVVCGHCWRQWLNFFQYKYR